MDVKPRNQQWVISIVLVLSLLVLVTVVQVDPAGKFYDPVLAQEEAMLKMGMDPALMGLDPMDPMNPLNRMGTTVVILDPAAMAAMGHRFGEEGVNFFDVDQGDDSEDSGEQRSVGARSILGQGTPPPKDDDDNDLTVNSADNCPFIANENQENSDSDSFGDVCDNCPNDNNENQIDSDGDGIGDACDDSDGDGVNDDTDICPSEDATGYDNNSDGCIDDSDSDGVVDPGDAFPNDSTETTDTDNDGVGNNADAFPNDPNETTDADGDGIGDNSDACPNEAVTGIDNNADGCNDPDADGDGIEDSLDNCPNAPNPDQANWDSDSAGDACDDSDGDGVFDSTDDGDSDGIMDVYDSCPATPAGSTVGSTGCSTSQTDSDGDSVYDNTDLCPNTPTGETVNSEGCSESQTDGDGDGVMDSTDLCPNEAATAPDADGDGCTDPLEDLVDTTGLEQGAAVVEQVVEWTNLENEEVITTEAPTLTETEVLNNEKTVTVSSDYAYQNVLTYATIPNKAQSKVKLHWMINGVKTDVTAREDFNVTFYDEDSDGLVDKMSWITPHLSTQEFVISFDEEIGVVLQIYLEEDHNFNSGPYPIDNNIIITVENSTVEGEVMVAGEVDILITLPDGTTTTQASTEWTFSGAGTETISAVLTLVSDSTINGSETRNLNIYNGLNAVITSPTDNTEINPGVLISFTESSNTLTEPITSWILDLGDESTPWGTLGILGNQQACFSSTNITNSCVSGILKNSDTQGDPCACSSYTPKIYPTTTIETSVPPGIRYHTYDSQYDCGIDGICSVTLTVSSENYTATDTINLKFEQPEVETNDTPSTTAEICAEFPNLAMCQDTPPVTLDSTFDPMTTETRGQTNFVAQTPPPPVTDPDPLGSTGSDDSEGSGIGGIVIILLLLSAVAGGGFFMWKRGMFEKLKARFQKKSTESITPADTTQKATDNMQQPDTTQQPATQQPTASISDYISKAKAAGESDVVIRQNLKNAGWSEDEINKNL